MGHGHGHAHGQAVPTDRDGMRALWISLVVLGVTAVAQGVVVLLSGSVALLSDGLHNVADALTAVPVGIAFLLGARPATTRFTYGYGRAEDLAGIVVVAVIAASGIFAVLASVRRLAEPAAVDHLPAVAAAAVVGAVGNEIAARVRIRTGRRIGSAALVADGLHARADALTSLAVLLSAGGTALGWRWADPVVGLAIGAMIAAVTWTAARQVLGRLLDAVDPELVERARGVLANLPGVATVDSVRLRWVGHTLRAEVDLGVPADLTLRQAHDVAHAAEHRLCRDVPRLAAVTVHAHPAGAH